MPVVATVGDRQDAGGSRSPRAPRGSYPLPASRTGVAGTRPGARAADRPAASSLPPERSAPGGPSAPRLRLNRAAAAGDEWAGARPPRCDMTSQPDRWIASVPPVSFGSGAGFLPLALPGRAVPTLRAALSGPFQALE